MFELLNPVLLGGLAAVAAPLIIHLLHRRKVKQMDWGAMRFLAELVAQQRRRLFLEQLLLLLVRALLVACLALAMVRPAFHPRNGEVESNALVRQNRVAAVMLVDDSLSCAAGRAQPSLETMKKIGVAYLDSLTPGDEVSVLALSQLGKTPGDPVFDLEEAKSALDQLKPGFVATDIPALLDAALEQLKRHLNPGAELVLLTDGRREGWQETDRGRWEELRTRLRGTKSAALGSRQRPRVLVLAPESGPIEENLAITALGTDQTLVSAGKPVDLRITVANYGLQASQGTTVQLTVNGRIIDSRNVQVAPGARQQVLIRHTFPEPGSYGLEAALVNHHDLLAADDRRTMSLQVEPPLAVLLAEDGLAQGLSSKLGFLAHALDPEPDHSGAFRVTRIPVTQFLPSTLSRYRVVVLGDLRVLDPAMVDALERFVVGGGGVLVGLGPSTNPDFINRYWARGGEGFLPCPLGPVAMPQKPALPAAMSLGHPVFNGFDAKMDEAWKEARVTSWFKLDTAKVRAADLDVLLRLDNGDPLLVERRRGLGLVTLFSSSLNADWTVLPLQAAYVPLLRGVVGRLGSFIIPPRNLLPGERIIYARVSDPVGSMQGEDNRGQPLNLALGAWEGRDAILSEPLMEPGLYQLHYPRDAQPIHFAVALAPAESALQPIKDREIAQAFDGAVTILHSPEQVAANLDPARRQSVELWKGLLAGAIALMFVEGWLTRREARTAS
jgi:hypothetical protein